MVDETSEINQEINFDENISLFKGCEDLSQIYFLVVPRIGV